MSYITYHMQDPFLDWNKYLAEAYAAKSPFPSIKTFHPEDYGTAQAASPGILMVYRDYADKANQGAWIERAGVSSAEADKAADEYIVRFKDSVNTHMGTAKNGLKFAESLNEEYPTDNIPKLKNIVAFDRAFVRRLPVHCPGVLPVVFTAAVGNPDHDEYNYLIDLAKETAAAGGAFGYHAYTSVYQGQDWIESATHQRDLHLRWDVIDKYFISLGIRVKWFLGEGGPIKSNPDGYGPSPIPGWKHGDVYGGSVTAYIDHLRRLDSVLAGTQAAKDGRLLGLALFTKPGWNEWATFDLPAFEIKEYVKANPSPPPIVIDPDPDPDPNPDLPPVGYKVVVNLLPQDATVEEKAAVAADRHTSKETICQSADDAGRLVAAGGDGSFVRAYAPERWGTGLVDYLVQNYDVAVETASFPKA